MFLTNNNNNKIKAMTQVEGDTKRSPTLLSVAMTSTAAADDNVNPVGDSRIMPLSHPEEPLLNCIPAGVFPTYRPISLPLQLTLILLSLWTSATITWKQFTWLQPLALLRGMKKAPALSDFLAFTAKALVLALFAQSLINDLFLAPSRLKMDELLKQYFLPSSLSKYEKLHIVDQNGQSKILGVHFLEYSSSFATNVNFDALYVNHGFGASSLSWLPAIPSLTRQLKAKVCLGHDAVGLGFTERPEKDLKWFSTKGSATIGTNLLIKKSASTPPKSVALFGHSMGSLTTLKMALQLPKETTKLIVLCAPALGLQLSSPKNKKKRWWHPIGSTIRKGLVYPIITYSLRRVVGTKDFWKKALQQFWGDPLCVRDSDALRFQWPAIAAGWENGLLDFSRAQTMNYEEDGLHDDTVLLRRVLELPNCRVFVIQGSNDRVVPASRTRKFLKEFQDRVPIMELEGLGHDPFEENTESFCRAVDEILKQNLS